VRDDAPRLATLDDDGWALVDAEHKLAASDQLYWYRRGGSAITSRLGDRRPEIRIVCAGCDDILRARHAGPNWPRVTGES
jgi:hypothetical protein